MRIVREDIPEPLKKELKEYVYDIIGAMHEVYHQLDNGLPEYIYQEALAQQLKRLGYYEVIKEHTFHPQFNGEPLESYVKMDLVVQRPRGNVIIECKSIKDSRIRNVFRLAATLLRRDTPLLYWLTSERFQKPRLNVIMPRKEK